MLIGVPHSEALRHAAFKTKLCDGPCGCEKLIQKIGVRGDNFARRATDALRLFSGPGGVWGAGAPPAILVQPGPGGKSGGAQPPPAILVRPGRTDEKLSRSA